MDGENLVWPPTLYVCDDWFSVIPTHALLKYYKDNNAKIQGLEGMICIIKVMQDFVHQ